MATQRDMQRTPDDGPDAGDPREEEELPLTEVGNEASDVPGSNPDEDVPGEETPAEPSPADVPPDKPATQIRP